MTNGDRIRQMPDEELCKIMAKCPSNRDYPCRYDNCVQCWREYLKQEENECGRTQ